MVSLVNPEERGRGQPEEGLRIARAMTEGIRVAEGKEVGSREVNLEPTGIMKSSTTGYFLFLPLLA